MEPPRITHGESLWERLDVLRDQGSQGAKTCIAMGTFLRERASLENAYGQALIKAATRAKKSTSGQTPTSQANWTPSLVREGWGGFLAAINSWGKQHVGWAICVDQNISKNLREFAAKHQGHVGRLWAEVQELVSDLEVVQGKYYRAKDAYERACIDASRLLDERNKARESIVITPAAAAREAATASRVFSSTAGERGWGKNDGEVSPTGKESKVGGGSVLSSVSKMLGKVGEGMALAVGIAAGESILAELEAKVPEALRKVDIAESEYVASIMAVNGYTTEFQPELEGKLNQLQLLEESRIMHIREVLLRLDQASKGMLDCLLESGGTLEALSASLSRVDTLGDARAQICFVRTRAGLPPLESTASSAAAPVVLDNGVSGAKSEEARVAKASSARGNRVDKEELMMTRDAQMSTGLDILDLAEDGVERAFEGARDGTAEASRMMNEMFCFLAEVVSGEETYARDLLRLLERQGYEERVARSGVTGPRGSMDFHAIGATMEDVGKNVMANMSGISSSSSMCAKVVAGEGHTLTKGWNSSAVDKALVGLAAHTGLARSLATESCPSASKLCDRAKASVAQASKVFATALKQLVTAKSTREKAASRHDKICREVREKEENLAKARVDLDLELQPSAIVAPNVDASGIDDGPHGATISTSDTPAGNGPTTGFVTNAPPSPRRDGPWVLESLGLGQGTAATRMHALELRLKTQCVERDMAKQALEDSIQGVEAALSTHRETTKDLVLALLSEGEDHHREAAQLLDSVLAALLETAKAFAAEHMRAEESKTTWNIDGRKDVEELVGKTAHRVRVLPPESGSSSGGRAGHGDGVGEVMFMAYHSEVLQQERDLLRRTHLLPPSETFAESGERGTTSLRRAGGSGHPLFTAMAEAALAQAHAKQQQRQMRSTEDGGVPGEHRNPSKSASSQSPGVLAAAFDASLASSVTDGEETTSTKSRHRRRYRRITRHSDFTVESVSDSEMVLSNTSLPRFLRGSLHGATHGSGHGSRNGSRHGGLRSLRNGSRHGLRDHDQSANTDGTATSRVDGTWADVDGTEHSVSEQRATRPRTMEVKDFSGFVVTSEGEGFTPRGERDYPATGAENNESGMCNVIADDEMSVAIQVGSGAERGAAAALAHAGETSVESEVASMSETVAVGLGNETGIQSGLEETAIAIRPSMPPTAVDGPPQAITGASDELAAACEGGAEVLRANEQTLPGGETGTSVPAAVMNDKEGGVVHLHGENADINSKVHTIDEIAEASNRRTGAGDVMDADDGQLDHIRLGLVAPSPGVHQHKEQVGPASTSFPTEEYGPLRLEGRPSPHMLLHHLNHQQVALSSDGEPFPTEEYGPLRLEGRPSLHSLRNRLNRQQSSFSSGGEVEDVSSSDEEQVSPRFGRNRCYGGFVSESNIAIPPSMGQSAARRATDALTLKTMAIRKDTSAENKVIESYSCALYGGGLPLHGRLSVTASNAHFSGWRNTKVVFALSDVTAVEKASTLRIVPNALTVTKRNGEKITLGSFLYRDDCYTLLTTLVNVSSSISRLGGGSLSSFLNVTDSPSTEGNGFTRVRGPAQVADLANANALPEPSEDDPGVALPWEVSVTNQASNGSFESMVDATLPCTVAQAFAWLWGRDTDFWEDFLRAQGEVDLTMSPWKRARQSSPGPSRRKRELKDLFPGDTFDEQRELTFIHTRTGFVVGPRQVFTHQAQGYRVERRSVHSDEGESDTVAPMDRVVLCQSTQMERAPMADHFTILGRILLVRERPCRGKDGATEPRCRLVIGFDVAFHKSTMLRNAIRSGAADETGTTWKAWLLAAKKVVEYQRHRIGHDTANRGDAAPPPRGVFDLANSFTARDGAGSPAESSDRNTRDKVTAKEGLGEGLSMIQSEERDNWTRVASLIFSLGKLVAASLGFAGVPTVLTLCCLILIAAQQRTIGRLADQVEDLITAVSELRGEAKSDWYPR